MEKFCLPTWAWECEGLSIEESLRRISALGAKYVETWIWTGESLSSFTRERIKGIKSILDGEGLKLWVIDLHPEGMLEDSEEARDKAEDYAKRCVETGAELGVKIVTSITTSLPKGVHYRQGWERTVSFASKLVEYSKARGVTFVIEPEPGTIISNGDAFLRLAEEVPDLKANMDIGHHHLVREGIRATVEKLSDYIAHVHIDDNDGTGDQSRPPGEGTIGKEGFLEFLLCLEAANYQGVLAFDVHPAHDPDGALLKSMSYLRGLLDEI